MRIVSRLAAEWTGSAWPTESTFHQLSPYIGKTKSSMAASLVAEFTKKDDVVYDPFAGCGSFAFESWRSGRHVIANDLSPYGTLLTRAKLFPYRSLNQALRDLERVGDRVARRRPAPDLRTVPPWIRQFFHRETLRETLTWTGVLRRERRWFLLACLMGILHHQRPGFLSFPSSHSVPYLRVKKFPRTRFPELYGYRPLKDRLEAKVRRAFRRVPELDFGIRRRCYATGADTLRPGQPVSTVLTSPRTCGSSIMLVTIACGSGFWVVTTGIARQGRFARRAGVLGVDGPVFPSLAYHPQTERLLRARHR